MINLEELIQFTELLISVATLFYVLGRNNGKRNSRPDREIKRLFGIDNRANRLSVALL